MEANATKVNPTHRRLGSVFRRSGLSIGTRLTACFVVIVLSMIAGYVVVIWQFRQMAVPIQRLSNADQTSVAAVHVHLDIDTFRDRLAALASNHDIPQFAGEAKSLRQRFLADIEQAEQAVRASPEIEQDATTSSALQTLKVTLPAELDTAVDLATAGDWTAVRLRVPKQTQNLIDVSSLLVDRVNQRVLQERSKAVERTHQARQHFFIVVPIVGLLTLMVAVALGWYATQSITVPLAELASGAQALARGDFRREVNVGGNDELAVVGSAFNHAARQLQQLYEELRDSEEQWRAAFESNPTMYFMVDSAGTIASVNTFGAGQLGYMVGELLNQPMLNGFYEPDREAVQQHAQECFKQSGRTMEWDARKIRKDGTMLWVRETANAVVLKERPVLLVVCEDITEQKRAEEAAHRSEKELRNVIETIPVMAFTTWPDGSNSFANRRWREYTGLSTVETSGSGWRSAVHPEDVERHANKWRLSVATGEPFEDEARFRCAADGNYRWFLVRAVPLRDGHGNILRWYGKLTDIEDLKRAEALIAGEKRVLELVAKGDPFPEILCSLCQLVEEQASDALASILSVEGDRLKHGSAPSFPKAYTDAIDGGLIGPCAGSCGTAAYRGQQVIVEDIATDPLWANYCDVALPHSLRACWSTPIVSSQGKVIATFAMYYREPRHPSRRDQEIIEQITHLAGVAIERKLTYDQLQRSEAYLAESQKLTHTGSWAYKPGGSALYWSEENFRIWGVDAQQGAPDLEIVRQRIHPEDRDTATEYGWRAVRAGTDYSHDFRIVLPDGTLRHIHSVGHPVLGGSGEVIEVVGTHLDITERKRAEEERDRLRKLEAELAHINRVSMLGELAGSLGHEIKQPIAAAVTNASTCLRWLKRDRPDLEEAQEAAARMVEDAMRAAEIIDRMKSLYKKDYPQREMVNVNEVIKEIVALLRNEAARHGISIRSELAADIPNVRGDRVQLQQVLMNLLINGIDAMKEIDGVREITITSKSNGGDELLVAVSDTGVGLPVEVNQIFDAFFTTKAHGTGMGLAISRTIIESHGGRLAATSNADGGATLYFTLPAASGMPA